MFITGVSSGFGRALAQQALAAGHRVVGTVRTREAQAAFEQLHPGQAFGRLLDVTEVEAIPATVAQVEAELGPIDVLVNNAGYGHEGVMEESSLDELRRQFEVNVFGAVAMMKAVLPFMRQRRRGHIINITSMGGFITMPGISYYCGSKFVISRRRRAMAVRCGHRHGGRSGLLHRRAPAPGRATASRRIRCDGSRQRPGAAPAGCS